MTGKDAAEDEGSCGRENRASSALSALTTSIIRTRECWAGLFRSVERFCRDGFQEPARRISECWRWRSRGHATLRSCPSRPTNGNLRLTEQIKEISKWHTWMFCFVKTWRSSATEGRGWGGVAGTEETTFYRDASPSKQAPATSG